MAEECIFCEVIAGRSPSTKFYEDEDFVVIKNIYPVVDGHMLVVPKKHFRNFMDLPEGLYEKFLVATREVLKKKGIKNFNLVINEGRVAGQIIEHLHLHILPRGKDDGFKLGT